MRSISKVLLIVLILASCQEGHHDEEWQAILSFGIPMLLLHERKYELKDNLNGTVDLYMKNGFGSILESYVYKKCLQGQVYRTTENDCRGAGSEANLWNASLLQYCSTEDNACNPMDKFIQGSDDYVFGSNSQIYVSCDSDTTAGLKWYPVNGFGKVGFLYDSDMLKTIFPDIPWDNSINIWLANSKIGDSSQAGYSSFPRKIEYINSYDFKKAKKYTFCGTSIPK